MITSSECILNYNRKSMTFTVIYYIYSRVFLVRYINGTGSVCNERVEYNDCDVTLPCMEEKIHVHLYKRKTVYNNIVLRFV